MRWYWMILSILLSGCVGMPSAMALSPSMTTAQRAPTVVSTATPVYAMTIQAVETSQGAAEATSEAAMLELAAMTAQKEAVDLQYAQLTAGASLLTAQADQWTATAAPSAVPGTQTAAAIDRGIAIGMSTQVSAAFTATFQAPTQLVAMDRAQDEVEQAPLNFIVRMFMFLAMAFFFMAVGVFTLQENSRRRVTPAPLPVVEAVKIQDYVEPEPSESVVTVQRDAGGAFPSMEKFVVPCTPEQLENFVKGILSDGASFAYDYWTRRQANEEKAPFTRDEYTLFRNWMQTNRLVLSTSNGSLALSPAGESLFIEFLNSMTLPEVFRFATPPELNHA